MFGGGRAIHVDNKDSIKKAVTRLITELGELEGTFRKSDISFLKAFISEEMDEIRLPYERTEVRWPRRTAFCATVNMDQFLVDQTGNTRFWTMVAQGIDLDAQRKVDKEQFWLQIREMYRQDERWWMDKKETVWMETGNEAHREISSVEQALIDTYDWSIPQECWARRTLTEVGLDLGLRGHHNTAAHRKLREALIRHCGEQRKSGNLRYWKVPPIKSLVQVDESSGAK